MNCCNPCMLRCTFTVPQCPIPYALHSIWRVVCSLFCNAWFHIVCCTFPVPSPHSVCLALCFFFCKASFHIPYCTFPILHNLILYAMRHIPYSALPSASFLIPCSQFPIPYHLTPYAMLYVTYPIPPHSTCHAVRSLFCTALFCISCYILPIPHCLISYAIFCTASSLMPCPLFVAGAGAE